MMTKVDRLLFCVTLFIALALGWWIYEMFGVLEELNKWLSLAPE